MKALRLVAQAGYTGATKDKVLRDNIISGLASDKIQAKNCERGSQSDTTPSYGDSQT